MVNIKIRRELCRKEKVIVQKVQRTPYSRLNAVGLKIQFYPLKLEQQAIKKSDSFEAPFLPTQLKS